MRTVAVCVGDNCIDRYLPPIGRDFVGGNAVNVAVHLQQAGIPTAYVGVVGDDAEGRLVQAGLRRTQVDISHLRVQPGKTGVTEVRLTPTGDREFAHEDMGVQDQFELDTTALSFISRHRLVHNTLAGGTTSYLTAFKQTGLTISFDYGEGVASNLLEQSINLVDIAFVSLPGRSIPEAENFAHQLSGRGPELVVVTLGKRGSLAYDGQVYYQPSLLTAPVDTLGAGDTFIAIFLAGWLKGKSRPKALSDAAFAAAQTCTHLGAWLQETQSQQELHSKK